MEIELSLLSVSPAMESSKEPAAHDLEAGGITSPLLAHEQPSTSDEDIERGNVSQQINANGSSSSNSNLVSRMQKALNRWWGSSHRTPCKTKLYTSRFLLAMAFSAISLLALCAALALTCLVVMMVPIPRLVVVNYLVNPYIADPPDWGPSLIAFVSAVILGALFVLDDWAERVYGKQWFGLCEWSGSWSCAAAQLVFLYLLFETVYIALSTFILSSLTVSLKVASMGVRFVALGPSNVLALLLASTTVAILMALVLYHLGRKVESLGAEDDNVLGSRSIGPRTLVLVDAVLRATQYVILFIMILCTIYLLVYGSYHLNSLAILEFAHRFQRQELPTILPFPTLD